MRKSLQLLCVDLLLAMKHEVLVNENDSMNYTDNMLVAFPKLTAARANTKDLNIEGEVDWMKSLSSIRCSDLMTRFDLSTTVVHRDDGCQELSSHSWPAVCFDVDEDGDNKDSYEVGNSQSIVRTSKYASVVRLSQYTLSCIDGASRSDANEHLLDEEDAENSTSAVITGVVKGLLNTRDSDVISSIDDRAGKNEDYYECEKDDELFIRCMSDERDVRNSVSYTVSEVARNSQNSSSGRLAPFINPEPERSGDHRECDEFGGDKHRSDGLLSACETGSDRRYISSLYVTLAAMPRGCQTSLCSTDDQSCPNDVSEPSTSVASFSSASLHELLCL